MGAPSWAVRGRLIVCIDDNWRDIFEIGDAGIFPAAGEFYTIAGTYDFSGQLFLILAESNVSPQFYSANAFRPLTEQEVSDRELFAALVKGVAGSSVSAEALRP